MFREFAGSGKIKWPSLRTAIDKTGNYYGFFGVVVAAGLGPVAGAFGVVAPAGFAAGGPPAGYSAL